MVDWHNYGYTILALSLGAGSPLVAISRWYEAVVGRMAHASLCVTAAMRRDLATRWSIEAQTLYDRPPASFRRIDVAEAHELFVRLDAVLSPPPSEDPDRRWCMVDRSGTADATLFTVRTGGRVAWRPNRPVLVVSSTSWTADEDFGLLLDALGEYDRRCTSASTLPRILCVITGRGPLREAFEARAAAARLQSVCIRTCWLPFADYPRLLGTADLGISLHTSSSGLDLPMKVVDMLGCALPVCAAGFEWYGGAGAARHGTPGHAGDAAAACQS